MQGSISQIVALVIEGNAVLRGIPSRGLDAHHSTTGFCEFVHFVDLAKSATGWSERPIAASPNEWFRYLAERQVTALRMAYVASNDANVDGKAVTDRMLAGFVRGGGRWLLQADNAKGADLWEGRWIVGDRDRMDRRIWQVTYGRVARNRPAEPQPKSDLGAVRDEFSRVLSDIGTFASEQKLDGFAQCFERALADLSATSDFNGFHREFANPHLLPVNAIQLLSASQSAWVFGGMGSWNDMGFARDTKTRYDQLSDALYRVINQAIVVATNSSAFPPDLRAPAPRAAEATK
jgi:hypothetical protein